MSSDQQSATGELSTAVRHAMTLLSSGEIGLAKEQAEEILRHYPDEVNSRFIIAAALRAQGHKDDATQRLEDIARDVPDFALVHQELGFALADAGELYPAIQALQTAVRLQPNLPASWKKMGELFLIDGDEGSATEAFRQNLLTSNQNPDLVKAIDLFRKDRLGQAERLCRAYLQDNPNNVNAIRLLAEIGTRVGVYVDAEYLLHRCLELAPDFQLARLNYSNVLSKREKLPEALAEIDKLLALDAENPAYLAQKAAILVRKGDFENAIPCYEFLIENFPARPNIVLSYGHALKTVGRQDEAIENYREAVRLQPTFGDGYWSLANLKTFRFEDEEINEMRTRVEEKQGSQEDHFNLCFALGKALDDRGDYDEAFRFYELGNAIKKELEGYDAIATHELVNRIKMACTRELFDAAGNDGNPAQDPIFIVGLPRSGSTLLEQILSSHSQVDGTKELVHILSFVRRLGGRKKKSDVSRYPAVLAELSSEQRQELGQEFLDRSQVQRGSAPFFIDKMPNNFFHIGLIRLILPKAKIIDARRHPLASCFSGYSQLFTRGQPFTYGLSDIGRYYCDYVDLMDHWDEALPGKILRVQYEEVVADLEAQVRRILDFCGLPFEDECLEFYRTERAVRTASSEQVRQPIYQAALEHWRNYESHLDELRAALQPIADRYSLT